MPAAAALYALVRRQADAARELHDAQVAHERTQHENAEARLQVMQAQVEPHFLFNSLASVRRLYQTDAQAGHAMLDFIDYLAASLPAMRESESTVKREVALAVAYLEVQKIRMDLRLAFAVDVPAALGNIVIPPLMVATLVEDGIRRGEFAAGVDPVEASKAICTGCTGVLHPAIIAQFAMKDLEADARRVVRYLLRALAFADTDSA